jgi:hypothetical protein
MLGVLETESKAVEQEHFAAVLDSRKSLQSIRYFRSPFRKAEMTALALIGLGRTEEAIAALSAATTQRIAPLDVFQPEIYALFAQRNAAGVEKLLSIWRAIEPAPEDPPAASG